MGPKIAREPLKNVSEAASARKKLVKRGSLYIINDRFEPIFNAAIATQVVFQKFPSRQQLGFTLLEVMVSIAIFSVIALGSWQVLDRVTTSKSHIEQRSAQLRELHRGMWLLARDIRSIVDRPIRNTLGEREDALTSLVAGYPLLLTRDGWPNPLGEQRSSLQRVGYLVAPTDSGTNALMRHYWPVLDQAPESKPYQQVLLNDIDYFEVQFIDSSGNTSFHWPPNSSNANDSNNNEKPEDNGVPTGIRIRLTVQPFGDIERLFAIREGDKQST